MALFFFFFFFFVIVVVVVVFEHLALAGNWGSDHGKWLPGTTCAVIIKAVGCPVARALCLICK